MSGRILGTCSNDSDCCFVVLLSFFGWQAFYGFPKMHKNRNSLAVGIDSVYFFLELQILFVVQWMDQEKTSLPSGAQQRKLPTFGHSYLIGVLWSRGVLSFEINFHVKIRKHRKG